MTAEAGGGSGGESLAFFGQIVAAQSHEVTNVLTIINELAGLQEDLLGAADRGVPIDVARLRQVVGKLQAQVERGERILKNINRFAHSVDVPVAMLDLKESLSGIVFLAQRWARLRKAELVVSFPEDTTALEASPFSFGRAVFLCIDAALLGVADRRRITVSYAVGKDGTEVTIASADPLPSTPEVEEKVETLRVLLDQLGAVPRLLPDENVRDRFVLFFGAESEGGQGAGSAR